MSATKFGLIGQHANDSLLLLHRTLMTAAGIEGSYLPVELAAEDLPARAPALLSEMAGLTVETPCQQAIIPYLTGLDASAIHCGLVNTTYRGIGYNTEYLGFLRTCPEMTGHRVLLLGAGRISRIMAFAAASAGAELWIIARRQTEAQALTYDVKQAFPDRHIFVAADLDAWLSANPHPENEPWALLNGTPAGQWPQVAQMPVPSKYISRFRWIFDAIYCPMASRLVLAARSRGIPAHSGLDLLINQSLAAEQIWHPEAVFSADTLAAARQKLSKEIYKRYPLTLILNGFMGSGKTTVGEQLAAELDLPLIDLDHEIEKASGRTIPQIFAESGEPAFRDMERKQLTCVLKNKQSQILSVGGGSLMSPASEAIVRDAPAFVIYLDTPMDIIRERVGDGSGRPLLHNQEEDRLRSLFLARQPRYEETADLRVNGAGTPAQTAAVITACLGYEWRNKTI